MKTTRLAVAHDTIGKGVAPKQGGGFASNAWGASVSKVSSMKQAGESIGKGKPKPSGTGGRGSAPWGKTKG